MLAVAEALLITGRNASDDQLRAAFSRLKLKLKEDPQNFASTHFIFFLITNTKHWTFNF
ncbi:MAG: hypothetical protein OFPI_09390 [Osedax symbiont Rs2]|nr:MAG: hypothetical protein OFPI_09390 [Osedax symbiont Rs2]